MNPKVEYLLPKELSIYDSKAVEKFGDIDPNDKEVWEKIRKDAHYGWEYAHNEHSIKWCIIAPTDPDPENWVWVWAHALEGKKINLEGTKVNLSKRMIDGKYIDYVIEAI